MGDNKQNRAQQTTGSMPRESSQVGTHGQSDGNDRAQRDMEQGELTKPAQPSGTKPLDKDQQPVNQNRGQQNR